MEERERERDTVTHTKITNSLMKNNSWILLYIKKKGNTIGFTGINNQFKLINEKEK